MLRGSTRGTSADSLDQFFGFLLHRVNHHASLSGFVGACREGAMCASRLGGVRRCGRPGRCGRPERCVHALHATMVKLTSAGGQQRLQHQLLKGSERQAHLHVAKEPQARPFAVRGAHVRNSLANFTCCDCFLEALRSAAQILVQASVSVMESEVQGCIVCKSNARHCFCPTCAHDKLADVRRFLRQVQTKRAAIAQQLETAVPHKVCHLQVRALEDSAEKFEPSSAPR